MAPTEFISAAEAGRRIGVTEKTIRNWIVDGKLSAHHPGGAKNRLAIPVSEVDALARERAQYQEGEIMSQADLARQLVELRTELAETRARVEQLEQQLATSQARVSAPPAADLWHTSSVEPSVWQPEQAHASRPRRREPATSSEPLPPGAVFAFEFAQAHGVNRHTFRDHTTKGIRGDVLMISERPNASRPRETERYLTPEQQQAALIYWRRHGVLFDDPEATSDE